MFGNVRCVRQLPWPPIHHDTPRFSINTSQSATELAAVALVNESPTAATISISPGKYNVQCANETLANSINRPLQLILLKT